MSDHSENVNMLRIGFENVAPTMLYFYQQCGNNTIGMVYNYTMKRFSEVNMKEHLLPRDIYYS